MLKKGILISGLVTSAFAVGGCATMQDVVRVKESGSEGTVATYHATESQGWDIAKAVFRWEGADAIEEHRDQHYMLTSSGMNLVSAGTVMGAWVESIDANTIKVTVVTKRRIQTNIATTLTEGTFQKRFAQGVEIVSKGQPLPASAPN